MRQRQLQRQKLGDLLHNPDFTSIEGLWNLVEDLPVVDKEQAEHRGRKIPGAYWLTDRQTGLVNGVASDVYEVVQHKEAFLPILEGVRNLGLPVKGTIRAKPSKYGGRAGRVEATLFFESPRFRRDLRTGETLAYALRVQNGMDGNTGLGLSAFACNLVCTNGMTTTSTIGKVHVKHVGNPAKVLSEFNAFVERIVQRAAMLPGLLDAYSQIPIAPADVKPLLVGVDFGVRAAAKVDDELDNYLVDIQRAGPLTIKKVFDAATYYATHVYDRSVGTAEDMLGAADEIVRAPLPAIERGRRILAAAASRRGGSG